jgi:hypothetical protein
MSLLSRLAVQAARAYGILSSNPNNVTADYLVVAGGGSGGQTVGFSEASGGGGAGGYRTSTTTLSTLTTYTVTVGAGGAAVTTYGTLNKGSDSVFNSITSTGGGGGQADGAGQAGGSGGGGGAGTLNRGGGAGNTPSTSPSQGNNGGTGFGSATSSQRAGGGGGGASAVGATATASTGGAGGAGSASSISGSSVTYAGGGGGHSLTTGGAGGSGGGGAGGSGSGASGTNGTANRGGGGGGANGGSSGAGGSGIVIISYTSATPKFVGGTITTSGGKQIHTFTSSGTLSPITPITASYLVVSGGGGGGSSNGASAGGAGAGGLLTSSTTLYSGAAYIVTVGAGGAGGASGANNQGLRGSSSSVAGTGLTTISPTGGGGGGAGASGAGQSGGSGGGGGTNAGTGGSGTSGEGFAGGTAETGGNFRSGGGGGASAVGAAGTSGGTGGAGTASSITGSSITYAGGGGGGAFSGASGAGGAGGGGAGGTSSFPNGAPGASSLGGGGGGTQIGTGGNGGSGTVIISYAGSQAFNGGLVTTSGGNTIHTFTSTGALTPLTNNLTNSLRFRFSASAFLNRTPSVAGNRKTWTWSAWVKRGTLGTGVMFSGGATSSDTGVNYIGFASDQLIFAGISTYFRTTSQVFRDPSAWYHIVLALDTTQATAADRAKIYINGNQVTAFAVNNTLTLNADYGINQAALHRVGAESISGGFGSFDGYMTDINFIDGQALEPYYFGNNDANGVWKPIAYKGTYGTNGFYLPFSDTSALTTSSNVGLGKDFSGNGNYWATNNISITAGTTYDAMTDVPTNTSATVANYAVLNPIGNNIAYTVSNGNLTINNGSAPKGTKPASFFVTSGKWYWEVLGNGYAGAVCGTTGASSTLTISSTGSNGIGYWEGGLVYWDGGNSGAGPASYTSSDVIGIALNMDAGTVAFYKNNSLQYTATFGSGTVPNLSSGCFPCYNDGASVTSKIANFTFGQRPFSYTPPTGFVALNTYNLPTPTILQGNKYMDATTYSGASATNVIVNQGQFKPDLVWIKNRSSAFSHYLNDSVRGVFKILFSNLTNAEFDGTSGSDGVSTFNSNGFTLLNGSNADNFNKAGQTYVGWQWQAGQGSTSSNTSGSITSTVSVNTTAGFSVVTYTGNSTAGATIGHGLGIAPKMIIVKTRNAADNWAVYHSSTGATQYLQLNTTNASASSTTLWNDTSPTSTVFSVGTNNDVNDSARTYVAYCWAEIAGFSRFGSYTGNGSTDGPFVYLGFRPKFIMIKGSSAVAVWSIWDTSRNTFNLTNSLIQAQVSDAESTNVLGDILSNGFKIRDTNSSWNSTQTYIYMAFAENPFKNANAR